MHAKDDNDDDDDDNIDNDEKHIQNFLSAQELIVQNEPFSFKIELQGEAQTQKSKVNEHQAYVYLNVVYIYLCIIYCNYERTHSHRTLTHYGATYGFHSCTRYIEKILCVLTSREFVRQFSSIVYILCARERTRERERERSLYISLCAYRWVSVW